MPIAIRNTDASSDGQQEKDQLGVDKHKSSEFMCNTAAKST